MTRMRIKPVVGIPVAAGCLLVGILLIVGFVVGILFTLIIWGIYWLYAMIISIVAAVKANNGEYYSMPLIIPFLR